MNCFIFANSCVHGYTGLTGMEAPLLLHLKSTFTGPAVGWFRECRVSIYFLFLCSGLGNKEIDLTGTTRLVALDSTFCKYNVCACPRFDSLEFKRCFYLLSV